MLPVSRTHCRRGDRIPADRGTEGGVTAAGTVMTPLSQAVSHSPRPTN